MSTVQLSFSIRVSSSVKSVALVGTWDGYSSELPLSRKKGSSRGWEATFAFDNGIIEAGERYWYYYILDGREVSYDDTTEFTVESKTGRYMNILDAPKSKSKSSHSSSKSSSKHSSSSSKSSSSKSSSSKHSSSKSKSSRDLELEIPRGRPVSMSKIKCPSPISPSATKNILTYDAELQVDDLAVRLSEADFYNEGNLTDIDDESLSSSSSSDGRSYSPGSYSGYSTPASDVSICSCERYGITRSGQRVRLDCRGTVCGYDSQSCSDSESDEPRYSRHRASARA
jgi:hypothetical protein